MSSGSNSATSTTPPIDSHLPPLDPASNLQEENCAWARFDDGLRFAVEQIGKQRAPTEHSVGPHQIGFAGELTTSGLLEIPVNREVYDGFNGDNGHDLELRIRGEKYKIEVKTVSHGDLELRVNEDAVDDADYFVLCKTSHQLEVVRVIGWVNRNELKKWGQQYPEDSALRLRPEWMHIFEPIFVTPDRIRNAQTL